MRAISEQSRPGVNPRPSFISRTTSDVLLQASALPAWNQEYVQISEGRFSGTLQDLSLGQIQIFRETMDKAVDQHGMPWKNSFAIGVPNQIMGDGYWCGDRLEENSVFFLKPNSELKFRTPSKSDIFVAVVDMQLLSEYAERIEDLDASRITSISGASAASSDLCNAIRANLTNLFIGLSTNPLALENELIQRELSSETMHIICDGLSHINKVAPHNPGQFVHRHIVEKAREFILSRYSQPPGIVDICKELRISRRTLHYAFHKVLGINPISYLRYIRLHGARHMLLTSPPGKLLICEIAAQWGFLHTGMFCTYYRQLFGETPSATLTRNTTENGDSYKSMTVQLPKH